MDSATETAPQKIRPSGATPNSESYVSTSESSEPASKAQVLEELKARIRELEGSPHYKCFICKVSHNHPIKTRTPVLTLCGLYLLQEGCKTLVISTICGHYLCEDCWVNESVSHYPLFSISFELFTRTISRVFNHTFFQDFFLACFLSFYIGNFPGNIPRFLTWWNLERVFVYYTSTVIFSCTSRTRKSLAHVAKLLHRTVIFEKYMFKSRWNINVKNHIFA